MCFFGVWFEAQEIVRGYTKEVMKIDTHNTRISFMITLPLVSFLLSPENQTDCICKTQTNRLVSDNTTDRVKTWGFRACAMQPASIADWCTPHNMQANQQSTET